MQPPTHSRSSRTTLSTRTASPGARAPLVPCLYKIKPAGRRERLRLALQPRVVGRMLREHVVEDGEEARVSLEGFRRWREGGRGANCEGRVWGCSVEVGKEVAVGLLGVWEDFLRCGY